MSRESLLPQAGQTRRIALLALVLITLAVLVLVPMPAASAGSGTPLAQNGDRGLRVLDIQSRLDAAGFSPGPLDGIFGPMTEAAVRSFQDAKALPVTGIVDQATYDALIAATDGGNAILITRGERGSHVLDLQTKLNAAGFSPGPLDGKFGILTETALRNFQASVPLPVTGSVDQVTYDALEAAIAGGQGDEDPAADDPPADTALFELGDRGSGVLDLQTRLNAAGFSPGPLDGKFGVLTQAAVSRFQTSVSLPATGVVDQATWDLLTGGGDQAGPALLSRGDQGDAVLQLQVRLGHAGFSPGPLDGKFGALTELAVKSFQAGTGLPITGTVDQATADGLAQFADGGAVLFRPGDTGAGVADLQERLTRLRFAPGPIDGKYGSQTATAVVRFQSSFGLTADGIVNEATMRRFEAYEKDAEIGYSYGYDRTKDAEQWRPMVTEIFSMWGLDKERCAPGNPECIEPQIDNAILIMQCESKGSPFAVNSLSLVTGLFQHRPIYWAARVQRVRAHFPDFPSDASMFNPEHNTMVSALLVWESSEALYNRLAVGGTLAGGPSPWSHWSCRRYLPGVHP